MLRLGKEYQSLGHLCQYHRLLVRAGKLLRSHPHDWRRISQHHYQSQTQEGALKFSQAVELIRRWVVRVGLQVRQALQQPSSKNVAKPSPNCTRSSAFIQKVKATFNLYHDSASHLDSSTVAEKMISKLHVNLE